MRLLITVFCLFSVATQLASCGTVRPAPVKNISKDSVDKTAPVTSEDIKEALLQARLDKEQQQREQQERLARAKAAAEKARLEKIVSDKRKQRYKKKINVNQYIVKKSESLYSIAFRNHIDFKRLAEFNSISPPYVIHPGQKLVLTSTRSIKKTHKVVTKQPQVKSLKPSHLNAKNQKARLFDSNRVVKKWWWPVRTQLKKHYVKSLESEQGIDISGRMGDDIIASADGVVVYSGNGLVGYGNLIIIKHNQSYLSAYANNDKLYVSENTVVNAGDKIASMGKNNTGKVQLHFEIRFEGQTINPLKYIR